MMACMLHPVDLLLKLFFLHQSPWIYATTLIRVLSRIFPIWKIIVETPSRFNINPSVSVYALSSAVVVNIPSVNTQIAAIQAHRKDNLQLGRVYHISIHFVLLFILKHVSERQSASPQTYSKIYATQCVHLWVFVSIPLFDFRIYRHLDYWIRSFG